MASEIPPPTTAADPAPAAGRPMLSVRTCVLLGIAGGLAGLVLMRVVPVSPPGDAMRANLERLQRIELLRQVCGKNTALELCLYLHPDLAPPGGR